MREREREREREQEKKRQRIYDFLNLETKLNFFVCRIQSKLFFTEKMIFKERRRGGLNNKRKEGFLTTFTHAIKKKTHSVNKKAR